MTPKTTTELAADLSRIAADLAEAKQDAAMFARLKSAPERIRNLTAEMDKTIAERETVMAAEAEAKERDRFKNLANIRVIDTTPEESALRSGFTIKFTRRNAYDLNVPEGFDRDESFDGFDCLPNDAFDFLVERHPEQIPGKIRALADDPHAAFAVYFRGLRRGYISQ